MVGSIKHLLQKIYNRLVYGRKYSSLSTSVFGDKVLTSAQKYASLRSILDRAYDQAANGKGKERHANDDPFEDQPIMEIAKGGHGMGYQTGQAAKKLGEAKRLLKIKGKAAAVNEILGAINYAAAAVYYIENNMKEGE